jgi:hypothetical protein
LVLRKEGGSSVAEVDQKVMKFVEDTLKRSPTMRNEELFERVKKAHPSMRKLGNRQFNARYPLQVKRRRALGERVRGGVQKKSPPSTSTPRRKPRATPETPRDAVRQVLFDFATDLAAAEDRKDLVQVLAGVDAYVDQVLKGVARP